MPIEQFRMTGFNPDVAAHELPPDQWSDIKHLVPDRGAYSKAGGQFLAASALTPTPLWMLNFQLGNPDSINQLNNYWIFAGLDTTTKVFLHDGIDDTTAEITLAGLYASARPNDFTGGVMNGYPFLTVDPLRNNSGSTDIQYWPGTNTATVPDAMVSMPNQRSNYVSSWVAAHKNHIFAGHNVFDTTPYHAPDEVIWSDSVVQGTAAPGTWIPAAGNEAGNVQLTATPGQVIHGVSGPNDRFYVFKNSSVYAGQYIGGNEVYSWRLLSRHVGVVARHCAQVVGNLMYICGTDDVVVFDGYQFKSICDNRTRNEIFTLVHLAGSSAEDTFTTYRPDANEFWVIPPASGQVYSTRCFIYNIQEDKWGERQLENYGSAGWGIPFGEQYGNHRLHMGRISGANEIHEIDQNNSDSDVAGLNWEAYRTDLDFGDRNRVKIVNRIRPRITSTGTPTISIQLGSRNSLDETIGYNSAVNFTIGTDEWITDIVSGKYISVRFSDTNSTKETIWGFDIEYELGGEF